MKKGYWLTVKYTDWHKCSSCNTLNFRYTLPNYCPNCGSENIEVKENESDNP